MIEHHQLVRELRGPEGYKGYLWGQATKYLFRWPSKKPGPEDLKKAKWYLDKLVEFVTEEQKP